MKKPSPLSTTIVETYLQSKTGKPQDCEDRIHISEHFIAVIDGATSNTNDLWDTQTGGQKSAEIIDATLHHLSHDCTARQAADLMTENIRAFYIEQDILDEITSHPERRITSSVVVFSLAKEEISLLGTANLCLTRPCSLPRRKSMQ